MAARDNGAVPVTTQEFFKNTGALRVVNSFCRGPAKGNCRGAREDKNIRILTERENAPLPKASRPHIHARKPTVYNCDLMVLYSYTNNYYISYI